MSTEAQVTWTRAFGMQVCVPKEWDDDAVKFFADQENPAGTMNGWQILREGDAQLHGDPERVACAHRAGFIHIVLVL